MNAIGHLARKRLIDVAPHVREALRTRNPVVCLESAILTHGMPFPTNLQTAIQVQQTIRDNGAIPATIGVVDGTCRIGLTDAELELLSRPNSSHKKLGKRDLASAAMHGWSGGTTVSATLSLAQSAGISVFVTGGIGAMDVSNDLHALSTSNVTVVCAGPKAILDVSATLEYLETAGVCVTTLGPPGSHVPAFYTRDSGKPSPNTCTNPGAVANLIRFTRELDLGTGNLVCVPIPVGDELDRVWIESVIERASGEAVAKGITGKRLTPFLLSAVGKATEGQSLRANVALVLENARVGAQIAVALSLPLPSDTSDSNGPKKVVSSDAKPETQTERQRGTANNKRSEMLVIGSTAIDVTASITSNPHTATAEILHRSHPGSVIRSIGGVACNVARAAALSGARVGLVSIVGRGSDSEAVDQSLTQCSTLDTQYITRSKCHRTATYHCVQLNGSLLVGVADMEIINHLQPTDVLMAINDTQPQLIVMDGNVSLQVAQAVVGCISTFSSSSSQLSSTSPSASTGSSLPTTASALASISTRPKLVFEPTSVAKSSLLVSKAMRLDIFPNNQIHASTPNILELEAMFTAAQSASLFERKDWWSIVDGFDIDSHFTNYLSHFERKHALKLLEKGVYQQAIHLLPFIPNLYVTLGYRGLLSFRLFAPDYKHNHTHEENTLIKKGRAGRIIITYHKPSELLTREQIKSDTGAGDTFTGVLFGGLVAGMEHEEAVARAQRAACSTLRSSDAVGDLTSLKLLNR